MLTADDRLTCCDTHIYIMRMCMCIRIHCANHFFSSCIRRMWYFTTHTLPMVQEVSADSIQTWIRSLSYVYRHCGVAIIPRRCICIVCWRNNLCRKNFNFYCCWIRFEVWLLILNTALFFAARPFTFTIQISKWLTVVSGGSMWYFLFIMSDILFE